MERTFGALLSSAKDIAASNVYRPRDASLPVEYSMIDALPRVRDQGNQPACVAFALSAIVEYYMYKKYNRLIGEHMSPQFIYNNKGTPGDGMMCSDGANIVCQKGVPYESSYKYGKSKGDIAQNVIQEALSWRTKSGAFILSVDALKSALVNNGPCLIAFTAYNDGRYPWRINGPEKSQGGHAMCVVGYDTTGFILRNSWGGGWADDGHTKLDFTEFSRRFETWTLVDWPEIHPENPPNEPAPNKDKKGCCVIM